MNQSLLDHAFGVQEGDDSVRTEYHHGTVEFHLAVQSPMLVCLHCEGRDVIRRGKRFRRIPTVPIGLKPVFFVTEVPRCQCRQCEQVFEVAPLLPRRRSTPPNG